MKPVEPATAQGSDITTSSPAISVVIPAYNEENAIVPTIEKVRSVLGEAGISYEIVVVNDGSKDGTLAAAKTTGVQIVDFPHNGGYGRALKAGIAVTHAPLVAIIDADGTYPAEALPEMIEMAAYNEMVVGDRGAAMKGVPLIRKPAKFILNSLASYLAQHKITDLNSGLRVFQRPYLERFLHLLPNAFSFTTTITLCMLASGFNVSYLPISYGKRVGQSKIKARDFLRFMLLVCRLTVYFQPLRVFLPIGLFLFVIGFGKGVYDIFLDNLSETAVFGMLGGVMIWSLGLIADMIARLHLRPPERR
ncbi:MAG: glycosyltransferase family 2 protein [Sphingobium sp.]|nr:glycosyltransferase family 2 protein [Sphingobium sp.]MCP5397830.1 glycosyltransferase family 2 protein [Sphingomonas sp.]